MPPRFLLVFALLAGCGGRTPTPRAATPPPSPLGPAPVRVVEDSWHEEPAAACPAFDAAWKKRPREAATYSGTVSMMLRDASRDLEAATELDDALERGAAQCDAKTFAAVSAAKRAALFDALYTRLANTIARGPDDLVVAAYATGNASVIAQAQARAMNAETTWRTRKPELLDELGRLVVHRYAEAVHLAHAARTGRVVCRASLRRLALYTYRLGDTKMGLWTQGAYEKGMFVRLRPPRLPPSDDPRAIVAETALDVGEPARALPIFQMLDDKPGLAETERMLGRTLDPFMQIDRGDPITIAERAGILEAESRQDLTELLAE